MPMPNENMRAMSMPRAAICRPPSAKPNLPNVVNKQAYVFSRDAICHVLSCYVQYEVRYRHRAETPRFTKAFFSPAKFFTRHANAAEGTPRAISEQVYPQPASTLA